MEQKDLDEGRCSSTAPGQSTAPSVESFLPAPRYWLKADFNPRWTQVSKEEWIKAERAAGFRPKLWSGDPNYMKVCATGGWGGSGVSGTITSDGERPKYGEAKPPTGPVNDRTTPNTDPSQATPPRSRDARP